MKLSDIELPSNRTFGLFFAAVFALACAYFIYQGAEIFAWILGGLAVIFLVVGLIKPLLLLPLNRQWMRFGLLLGNIVNPIILGLMFFFMFTPIGVLMRLFGRDELRLKPKPAASYWKVRDTMLAANSLKYQF